VQSLQGIGLEGNNMTGWNFAGQNLSNANLSSATLTNGNLQGANLGNANLRSATVTNGNLQGANLNNANLQSANLTNCNLQGATLTNAYIWYNTILSDADLRGAVGASFYVFATAHNTIAPYGTISGLSLGAGETLTICNYAGNIPITVSSQARFNPTASLQFVFDGQPWGSTMSFANAIPVSLAGQLDLVLAPGVDPKSLVGDTFKLFDWSGVSPTGQFSIIGDLPGNYAWDTTQLQTMGEVTLVPEPSALALMGVGTISLLAYAWRKRRGQLPLLP
jgi:hypothetical protein